MNESEPVFGVLLAHGRMAAGMVDAVRTITGIDDSVLACLSNNGLAPDQMVEAIEALAGDRTTVVFTDLLAGSCAVAARLSGRGRDDRAVLCGVNLPMLLDFVFSRSLPLDELTDKLVATGKEGVRRLQPPAGS